MSTFVENRLPNDSQAESDRSADAGEKREYSTPRVVELGDLRGFILGGSPGFGDSIGPTTTQA